MLVVLDPNVLVAAAITPRGVCGQILGAAIDGRYSLRVSPMLLLELTEVLTRAKFRPYLTLADAERFVVLVGDIAELHSDDASRTGITRDPDDDYLVALDETASSDYLISDDRDVLDLPNPHPPVLSLATFLDLLTAAPNPGRPFGIRRTFTRSGQRRGHRCSCSPGCAPRWRAPSRRARRRAAAAPRWRH